MTAFKIMHVILGKTGARADVAGFTAKQGLDFAKGEAQKWRSEQ